MRKSPVTPRFITKDMLRQIRSNANWREVFCALGLVKDEKKSNEREWWAYSPFTDEKTPSFHISDQGWYCHSSAPETKGGGVIELVQQVISNRSGRAVNCFDAGRWLLESGLSRIDHLDDVESNKEGAGSFTGNSEYAGIEGENEEAHEVGGKGARSEEKKNLGGVEGKSRKGVGREKGNEEEKENRPIRQTLVPALDVTHPEIERRGLSEETCRYLGFGYLGGESKGTLAGRMVFQVRGVQEKEDDEGSMEAVILTHMGGP